MSARRYSLVLCLTVAGCGSKLTGELGTETETETGVDSYSDHAGEGGGEICDPIEQDCGGGQVCTIGDSDTPFECQTIVCGLSEDQPCRSEGEDCIAYTECLPGLVCLAGPVLPGCGNELGCCARLCDLEDPQCAGGTECHDFQAGPTSDHVGACVLPP